MNGTSANLMVAIFDSLVCVKVSGRANFTSSVDFKKVVNELAQRGFKKFGIDLSECQMMDSTFLGVLAGIGLKFSPNGVTDENVPLILNPTARVADLLENLGVAHLFQIVSDSKSHNGEYKPVSEDQAASRIEVTRTCLEAHQTLMALNPENVRKFKDVTQFLAEDLKKMGG
jgi:anti-anti-sigma factor